MKVLYDISVLGLGYESNKNKAGIHRVVNNIAKELAASEEISLEFCASEFNYFYTHNVCLRYLKSQAQFGDIAFNYPFSQKVFYKAVNRIRQISMDGVAQNSNPLFLRNFYKALYKLINYCAQIGNHVITPIVPSSLEKADIYHSTVFGIPQQVRRYKHVKRFLTVYDLIPILHPDFFEVHPKQTHFVKEILDDLQPDEWVICISESTKNDLCNYKYIDPCRVFVSPLAADKEIFYPCLYHPQKKQIFERYGIPETPYFLGLSTLEPRKNIAHTIRSFLELVEQEKIDDLNLVLVGSKGWKYQEIFEATACKSELSDRVIFTGFVEDEDLAAIYSHALAFVYMSFYEGFGLPPLEAMNCGTPVITSNTSSLPEVVGDSGIMLPPDNTDQLCHELLRVYKDESLRQDLSQKSLERSQLFTWDKTCESTINAYKAALFH